MRLTKGPDPGHALKHFSKEVSVSPQGGDIEQ